jgi:hypothetical protein
MGLIIGLVGSARPWGNSEVLVREALASAQEAGASVAALRISDLHVEPCTGCMRCAFRSEECPIKDDMRFFLDTVSQADGLILAAPTYFLNVPGPLKSVFDRVLMLSPKWDVRKDEDFKPGGVIAVAGLPPWRGVSRPFFNAFLYALGFMPVGSVAVFSPGPGESLLDDEIVGKVRELGRRVALGEKRSFVPEGNTCPVCDSDFFRLEGLEAECPICGTKARIVMEEGRARLDFSGGISDRWTSEGLRKHLNEWIRETGVRFMAIRQQVKERRRALEGREINWIKPPEREKGYGGSEEGSGKGP